MSSIKITTNGSQEGALKIAFATTDMQNIDSHFGSATQFAVYDVSKDNITVCEILKVPEKDTDKTVELLKDIDIVYFTNIGAVAAAKIINSGIFPIKYKEIVPIDEELEKLKTMLGSNPPPFIKKIIEKKAA
ncbi:NifB/NifX family molybdenum-iron cluster-binding protein [Candidatus Marinarcus aquaticus]|uniref:Dinitrogenase iron-molybdenum cofactor biosynthesis protein n=1 Tax=Candidatus Marinarcus aquaticus TaxID=2044504 RepID=A0A4V1LP29_9BACT|nr:NifB/NifX family molybdenum-iron cluster-binding protein [Candidatus Marinarcus aquaticus]RXJ58080.1 dinitrogenase iron-molybdenum cofactor biosynthesis protein [Candidatus Marinarcus aquaticus]